MMMMVSTAKYYAACKPKLIVVTYSLDENRGLYMLHSVADSRPLWWSSMQSHCQHNPYLCILQLALKRQATYHFMPSAGRLMKQDE